VTPNQLIPPGKEQHMNSKDNGHRSDEITAQTTAALPADHLAELHTPTPPDAEAPSEFERLPTGAAVLMVKRGPNVGCRYVLDRPSTSAGRHPGSDIFLDDITVSRHHAEFRCETGEFSIVDTGSLNGTYVNRQPVDSAVLANGDEIQIGNFRLVFMTVPATE
jgi:pSer/pThr/pTyr-binding forkhead associated (FHA) protein